MQSAPSAARQGKTVVGKFQALLDKAFGTTDDDPNAMTHEYALQSLARLTYLIYGVKGTSCA
jgi:hypothetical protein